jgi:uncharacterized protein YutE (UPF0331/DUF86 family)
MDREVIEQKLEALQRSVQRVQEKCPREPAALVQDADAQDIVAHNLTRAVQLCVDIGAHLIADSNIPAPDTMGGTFDALAELGCIDHELAGRLEKAVGFRNIAVHNYQAIDWYIVHTIALTRLADFRAFAQAVVDHTPRTAGERREMNAPATTRNAPGAYACGVPGVRIARCGYVFDHARSAGSTVPDRRE